MLHEESKKEFCKLNVHCDNSNQQLCSMRLQGSQSYVAGEVCLGKFTSVKNDFSLVDASHDQSSQLEGQFRNQTHWDFGKREKVKKFRFVVCFLCLIGLSLSVMSRMMLNISIIEMTKDPIDTATSHQPELDPASTELVSQPHIPQVVKTIQLSEDPASPAPEIVSVFTVGESDDENPAAGLHFSWSVGLQNFLLSSFFIGYAPSMFFSGGIAEKYGSMSLLSVCVIGSALINIFTPLMAALSYKTLVSSRVVLGLLQGPLVPACYDLFNKWLTITEMNIMVPLVKVSMSVGVLAGTMLPGLVAELGHDWTWNFYIGGSLCLLWTLLWFPLATSAPQTNKWLDEKELHQIFRKKSTALSIIKLNNLTASSQNNTRHQNGFSQEASAGPATHSLPPRPLAPETNSIPWLSIISSPSVLVLTFVKFTYNFGMDFLVIQSAIYLSQIHGASTQTVSLLTGMGCLMQISLMSFVGALATRVVRNRSCGLSKTHWRKIFQGSSNFAMACIYCIIPSVGPDQFVLVGGLFLLIYFFWMFGAGGESMLPYDLSPKYPATIMGFAHSLSILSGFVLPQMCSLVLGDDKKDPARWNVLFLLISGSLTLGGLAFVLIIQAKPFLPSERAKYDEEAARSRRTPSASKQTNGRRLHRKQLQQDIQQPTTPAASLVQLISD